MCTFLQSLNLNALPETNNTVYLIIPFSQAGSCWNACHFKISIACQSCPQHTLSNSCILCNENGAGLKARNCVKFCCNGMMCKEQCMTTVETTNNSNGAKHYIYHNCACTYFIVCIIYLKHGKCVAEAMCYPQKETLQLVKLFHCSWWKCSSIFLLSKHLFVNHTAQEKKIRFAKWVTDNKRRYCKMRKWDFVQLTLLLFSTDTESGYIKEYLRLCKTNTISLHP